MAVYTAIYFNFKKYTRLCWDIVKHLLTISPKLLYKK